MRRLILILLLCLCARADETTLFALRVGDFADATPSTPIEKAYFLWGTDQWDQVLSGSETSQRLLAVSAAQNAGRVPDLKDLAPDASGARGALQRFLIASYQTESDWRDRDLSQPELEARAREAFGQLGVPKVDDDLLQHGLVELPLTAEAIAQFWVPRLGQPAIELYTRSFDPLLAAGPGNDWKSLGIYYQVMSLSHLVGVEAVLQQYRAGLLSEDDTLRHLMALALKLDQALADPSNTNKQMAARGFLGVSSARVHRALAGLVSGKSVSPVEAAFLTDQLNAAYAAARLQGSPKVLTAVQTDLFQALWSMQRPGWDSTMEEFLATLIPAWEERHDREALVVAYASLGRLRSFQHREAEAITALQKAIGLLEASVQESGKASGARLRSQWRDIYELLAQLLLKTGRDQEAAAVLDRGGQLDTLARFNLRGEDVAEVAALQRRVAGLQEQNADPTLIAATRAEYYAALDKLQRQEPAYRRLSVRPDIFSRLHLPADTVVVQLFPADDKLYLFVVTSEGMKIRRVPVSSATLDEAVTRFRRAVTEYSRGPTAFDWSSESGQALLAPMLELGKAIWVPLQADLRGKKQVAFVPTGMLSYFPLQALALPGPRFLVQDMQVAVLPKAADLEILDQKPASGGPLLALGDPDGSLPSARVEVQDLGQLLPGQTYLGAEATAGRLLALPKGTGYLHLATHGVLNAVEPIQSYLLLADSHLAAGDVANLDLDGVRVVTLSACQSALADRNPELGWDLFTLADAFGFARAPTLVASLWKVDDSATRELMVELYRGLKSGASRGAALQQAQLKEMAARPHPFYWASFELIGDWR